MADADMAPRSWLITGGCGFIGTSLIASLLADMPDVRIRVLDNLSVGRPEDLAEVCVPRVTDISSLSDDFVGTELVKGDIRNADDCLKACRGVDAVVHLAANTGVQPSIADPRADFEHNSLGTFNMLEACRTNGITRFVFASSGAPIGEATPPLHEEIAPKPISPYGASKLCGEAYCSAYNGSFGIRSLSLRFSNVYGPRAKHKYSLVAKFIRQALAGDTCVVYGDGSQTRDFIYIGDLVEALRLAASSPEAAGVVHIATGTEHTVNEVAQMLKEILAGAGIDMRIEHGSPLVGDVCRNYAENAKAERLLGWKPSMDLREGLARTVDFFLENAKGDMP